MTTGTVDVSSYGGTASLQDGADYIKSPQTYVAYVSSLPYGNAGNQFYATSGSVTVSPLPWQVGLELASDGSVTAVANQNPSFDNQASGEAIEIYNVETRSVLQTCQGQSLTCVTSATAVPQMYIAFVTPVSGAYPPTGWVARSGVVWAPDDGADGIENPSENYCASCYGDPVYASTGELLDTMSDLSVPGRGVALNLTRTYDSFDYDVPGPFGYGTSDSYEMYLNPDAISASSNLATASPIDVVQENGTTVSFTRNADGSYSAPSKVLATLVKNGNGTFTFLRRGQTTFVFTPDGALSSEVDRNGYTTSLAYNTDGRLSTVTDPAGRSLTFAYSGGLVSAVTDSSGRSVSYTYNSDDDLKTSSDPAGNITAYDYADDHVLSTLTDPDGNVTTTAYDDSGRVDSQSIGDQPAWTYVYNGDSSVTITDPDGNETLERYNGSEMTSEVEGEGTSAATETDYTYDPDTLGVATKTKVTSLGTRTWHYGYDDAGNLTSSQDPDGDTTSATFNSFDEPLTTTDENTVTTTDTYDSAGNLQSSSTPQTASVNMLTHFIYGANPGDVTGVTDPRGNTWGYSYDAYGQLASTQKPSGGTYTYSYTCTPAGPGCRSNVGWLYKAVLPRGNAGSPASDTYTYTYDDDGQTASTTDPLGYTSHTTYDANGNVASDKDLDGNLTQYTYGTDNELAKTTLPDTSYTKNSYDNAGNRTAYIDGNGYSTTYTYDPLNRVASMTTPPTAASSDGITTGYTYDQAGNLATKVEPKASGSGSLTTAYGYDNADRLTSVAYSDGTTPNVSFTYFPNGQRKTMTDGTGTTHYTYNLGAQLTKTVDGAGNAVSYGYTLDGQVNKLTYPNGHVVTRAYTTGDLLNSVTDWNTQTTTFGRDKDGDVTSTTFPNGVSLASTLNNNDQLTQMNYTTSAGTLAKYVIAPDDNDNTLSSTSSGTSAGPNQTYAYNNLNQLKTYDGNNYSYDNAGNLTTQASGATQTYDNADELTSSTSPAVTYSYDQRGNRTTSAPPSGSPQTYSYDQDNRLTNYSNGSVTGTYMYNGDGLRTGKLVGSTASSYSWDTVSGQTPQMLSDGSTSYIYGDSGLPIEQISSSGASTFLLADQQGSVRVLTNGAGTATGTYNYDPYGNTISHTGGNTSLRYDGQYQDDESGLYYLRARYYDAATAQFLTRDPLEDETGQPYLYAGDDPIDNGDPSGQLCLGNYCVGFHPGTIPGSVVNLGRGFSFGLSDRIANWISPDASCTVAKNGAQELVGNAATIIATFGWGSGADAAGAAPDLENLTPKIVRQMEGRGWTEEQIQEAYDSGERVNAINKANGNPATRYISPTTGQSVVVDDVTGQVIHVGGPGFAYGPRSGDVP